MGDPGVENADLKVMGDNDPVDVVEIGSATLEMGGVYPVKIVGVLAMIDDGELDWKMIAVNSKDPKFASVNDVADVEREFPRGDLEDPGVVQGLQDPGRQARQRLRLRQQVHVRRVRDGDRGRDQRVLQQAQVGRAREHGGAGPGVKQLGLDPASPQIIAKKKTFFPPKKKKKKKKS